MNNMSEASQMTYRIKFDLHVEYSHLEEAEMLKLMDDVVVEVCELSLQHESH